LGSGDAMRLPKPAARTTIFKEALRSCGAQGATLG
jgi:hypothetical protein